ncbi:hypothetical protein D3C86_2181260 [compost metagenome]
MKIARARARTQAGRAVWNAALVVELKQIQAAPVSIRKALMRYTLGAQAAVSMPPTKTRLAAVARRP